MLLAVGALAPAAYGNLAIPRIGLNEPLRDSLATGGPWMYWYDADTTAIAAHRTHGRHPFLRLSELRPGDVIKLSGQFYIVRKTIVVPASAVWILNFRGLVLSACSRADGTPTSASYRIVVFAGSSRGRVEPHQRVTT